MIRWFKYLMFMTSLCFAYLIFIYFNVTSDQLRLKTKWKLSGFNNELLKGCSDIYRMGQEELLDRNQKWSVEHYHGDVVLKVYRNNAQDWCRYSSKGLDPNSTK